MGQVDLAGSERNKKTAAVGGRMKEGININCECICIIIITSYLLVTREEYSMCLLSYWSRVMTFLWVWSLVGHE
jgi:hypothetical protein